jgi:hypothetical protein
MAAVMTISDVAIVIATCAGPVLAVQVQKFIERRGETKRRQVEVFRALMSQRASPHSPQYVAALNAVPFEYHRNTKVIDAWRDLLMHLNTPEAENPNWGERRVALFVELLKKMAQLLHYDFREAEIKDHIYLPKWQVALMSDQDLLRKGLVEILSGKTPLKMDVTGFPVDAGMVERVTSIQTMLIDWLEGNRSPAMKIESVENDQNVPRRGIG